MAEYVEFDGTTYEVLLNNKWDNTTSGEKKYLFFDYDMGLPNETVYKKLKTKYNKEKRLKMDACCDTPKVNGIVVTNFSVDEFIDFGSSPMPVQQGWKVYNEPNKGNNNMGYDCEAYNADQNAREHLVSRITNIWYSKHDELSKKFNKQEPDAPKTYDEIVAALADGKYTIRKDYFNKEGKFNSFGNIWGALSWRTADTQYDEVGYRAASKLLTDAQTKAHDAVTVLPPADGLAAVREFETYTV